MMNGIPYRSVKPKLILHFDRLSVSVSRDRIRINPGNFVLYSNRPVKGSVPESHQRTCFMQRIVFLFISSMILLISSCEKQQEELPLPPVDIFVLGSSFTNQYVYYFQMLSDSTGDTLFLGEASIGNAGLRTHIEESNTLKTLASRKWDYVMIQESGYMAGLPEEDSRGSTFPCVALLVDTLRSLNPGIRIGLFMTQAYERGYEERCEYDTLVCTYEGMQKRIVENNVRLAREFNLELAAVGYYWQKFSKIYPGIRLFSDDHSHGSPEGRFLTACIIYTTIFRKPVSTAISTRNLSGRKAQLIREFVNEYVIDDPEWQAYCLTVE